MKMVVAKKCFREARTTRDRPCATLSAGRQRSILLPLSTNSRPPSLPLKILPRSSNGSDLSLAWSSSPWQYNNREGNPLHKASCGTSHTHTRRQKNGGQRRRGEQEKNPCTGGKKKRVASEPNAPPPDKTTAIHRNKTRGASRRLHPHDSQKFSKVFHNRAVQTETTKGHVVGARDDPHTHTPNQTHLSTRND